MVSNYGGLVSQGSDLRDTVALDLPEGAYGSESFFVREREAVFRGNWTLAGFGHQIPEPGDASPVTVAGLPLLLVRDLPGDVRVFHNVCLHRGCPLIREPVHRQKRLTCFYHGWAYDLEGRLRARPYFLEGGRHDIVDSKAGLGLEPVRSAQWSDLIFVNLDGKAAPFEEYARPMLSRVADYDLSSLRHGDRVLDFDVAGNWKLVAENWLDALHIFAIHPELNDFADQSGRERTEVDGCMFPGVYEFAEPRAGMVLDPSRRHVMSSEGANKVWSFFMFPSVFIQVRPDHLVVFDLVPVAPDRTRERIHFYFMGEAADDTEHAEARRVIYEAWDVINAQDVGPIEGMQQGRQSTAFRGLLASPYWDEALSHFTHLVNACMAKSGLAHG